jgi:hypothetical protein
MSDEAGCVAPTQPHTAGRKVNSATSPTQHVAEFRLTQLHGLNAHEDKQLPLYQQRREKQRPMSERDGVTKAVNLVGVK